MQIIDNHKVLRPRAVHYGKRGRLRIYLFSLSALLHHWFDKVLKYLAELNLINIFAHDRQKYQYLVYY